MFYKNRLISNILWGIIHYKMNYWLIMANYWHFEATTQRKSLPWNSFKCNTLSFVCFYFYILQCLKL